MMPLRSPAPPMTWLGSYFEAPVASCPSASAVPRVAEAMPLMIAALRMAACTAAFLAVSAATASSRSANVWLRFSAGVGVSARCFGPSAFPSVTSPVLPSPSLVSCFGLDGVADGARTGGSAAVAVPSMSSRTPLCTTTALTRARSLRLPSRTWPARISPESVSRAWPPILVVYGVPVSASTGRPITQMAAAPCGSMSIVSEKFWSSRWQSTMLVVVYAVESLC
mmetsp:Transcript_102767/g.294550  ORF Transcript_102767/g.294550 Transcript_102767/m.294550 type:complete len:224 (+) Transcript_102767:1478-2149(+)